MMNILCRIAVSAVMMLSAHAAYAEQNGDAVMLKIGEDNITVGEVKRQWQRLFPEGQAPDLDMVQPEMRQNFLRSLMVERVLVEEAKKQGLPEEESIKQALEEAERSVLVKEFLNRKSSSNVTDSAVRSEYQRLVAGRKAQNEIRVRHILLHSEDEARSVREQLTSGAAFDEVAEKFSKDPATAEQGGDLGYMLASDLDKPFADAAFALKKHAISAPVKTQMGWHIIRVDEVRKATIPTFEQSREELRAKLQEQSMNSYVEQLLKQAAIVVVDPATSSPDALNQSKPAAKTPPVKKPEVKKPEAKPKPAPVAAPKPKQDAPFERKSATAKPEPKKPEVKKPEPEKKSELEKKPDSKLKVEPKPPAAAGGSKLEALPEAKPAAKPDSDE